MMKKYNHNIEIFTKEDDISYYLLGVFISDGCVVIKNNKFIKATLSSIDYEWVLNIRNIVSPNLPIQNLKTESGNNYFRIEIYSQKICHWLVAHGCIPQKSLFVKFPNVPQKYVRDFIRGCIDGDGSIGIYNYKKYYKTKLHTYIRKQCYLCSASKNFM